MAPSDSGLSDVGGVRLGAVPTRHSSSSSTAAAVGLVEAGAPERHADRLEHLLDRHRGAGDGVRGLGQRRVVERLLDLDRLARINELVHVRRHARQRYRPIAPVIRPEPPVGRKCAVGSSVRVTYGAGAMQVSSAVIPAAGAGTRFLPATKAVPKELMPIGDTPAIQLIIDEALGAGIEHIVVVSSHAKPAIERYFERDDALIAMLRDKGNDDAADRLASIGRDWRVTITYQDNPRGLGHAVGCAREAVGDQPVRGAAARRADGRLVAARPDERRVRPHRRQRRRGQAGATRPGQLVRRARPGGADRRRRRDPRRRPRREAERPDRSQRLHPDRPLRADARRVRRDRAADAGQRRRAAAHRRACGRRPKRAPFHGVLSRVARYDTGNPVGFLEAAIAFALRDPSMGTAVRELLGTFTHGVASHA